MDVRWPAIAIVATLIAAEALADPRDDYNRRNAERLQALFRMADANGDGTVSR